MRTDAWSSDEEHEPLLHRQGEQSERRRECFESESSGSRRRYVWIWDQFLKFFKSLFTDNRVASALTCTVVHVSQRRGPELAN